MLTLIFLKSEKSLNDNYVKRPQFKIKLVFFVGMNIVDFIVSFTDPHQKKWELRVEEPYYSCTFSQAKAYHQ